MATSPTVTTARNERRPCGHLLGPLFFGCAPMLLALCFLIPIQAAGFSLSDDSICCAFSTDKKPAWQTILDVPKQGSQGEGECNWFYDDSYGAIAFTGSQKIVAAFHLQCLHRSLNIPLPVHTLDIILQIDAQTGKVINRMEWKDISRRSNGAGAIGIAAANSGQFLLT